MIIRSFDDFAGNATGSWPTAQRSCTSYLDIHITYSRAFSAGTKLDSRLAESSLGQPAAEEAGRAIGL